MRHPIQLSAALIAFTGTLTGTALAQGSDDCTGAPAITGDGPHAYDTSAATTDPNIITLCGTIENDVWFSWTAGVSADHVVSFCSGSATGDTKIAVYDGCGGVDIACNDDACGLLSETSFNATAGAVYLIQVGNFAATGFSIGDFTVRPDLPVLNPANGHYYQVVREALSWPEAKTAAELRSFGGFQGHLATFTDQAEVDFVVANVGIARPWIGLSQNLSSPTYSEPGGGFEWVTGEPFSYMNFAAGEPNNNSASGGPEDYIEMFASGVWNDAEEFHGPTIEYLVEFDGGGTIGTNYCMTNPNSTGVSSVMAASGSTSVANNNLVLEASDMPNASFGFFVVSDTAGFVPNPAGSEGNLCVGGLIGRYVGPGQIQNTMQTGGISLLLDLTMIPQPNGFVAGAPGDTWFFQGWHRDFVGGMATSNFTDGLEITLN